MLRALNRVNDNQDWHEFGSFNRVYLSGVIVSDGDYCASANWCDAQLASFQDVNGDRPSRRWARS